MTFVYLDIRGKSDRFLGRQTPLRAAADLFHSPPPLPQSCPATSRRVERRATGPRSGGGCRRAAGLGLGLGGKPPAANRSGQPVRHNRNRLPIYDPANPTSRADLRKASIPVFLCPSDTKGPTDSGSGFFTIGTDDGAEETTVNGQLYHFVDGEPFVPLCDVGKSNYVGVYGTTEVDESPAEGNGIFFRNSRVAFHNILDGTSHTVMIGERHAKYGCSTWAGVVAGSKAQRVRNVGVGDHTPNNPEHHFDDFTSQHPAGVHFVFGDASVRRLNDAIDESVYESLCTRQGGEVGVAE